MNDFLEIKKISILKFFIDNLEQYNEGLPIKKEMVNLLLSTDSTYDIKEEVFSIILMLNYNITIKEQLIEVLRADVKFDFKIPHNSNLFISIDNSKNDGKNYIVDDSFLSMILSICISTLRGIILEKCHGTFLENVYLPVVDINKLRKNNKIKTSANNIH